MKLLLDEMHAPRIADALTDHGRDVLAVGAEATLRGLPDEDLLVCAAAEERAVVTENVADFAPLAARWAGERRVHYGLLFTNPNRFNRATLAYPGNLTTALRRFLDDPPINGESWIWWL